MPVQTARVSDVGNTITIAFVQNGTARDVSSASSKQIIVQSARLGTKRTLTAAFVTDGSDGQIYVATSVAWDEEDTWYVQGKVVLSGGVTLYSEIGHIIVQRVLV